MDAAIPFPSVQEPPETEVQPPSASGSRNSVHDSQITSSSKFTSSDKLSALRPSTSTSVPVGRTARPSHFGLLAHQRGYRHSLDASSSLPSFPTAALDLSMSDSWGRVPSRRETNPPPHPSGSGTSSPGKETPRQRRSIEGERGSPQAAIRNVAQAFARFSERASDPSVSPPIPRPSALSEHLDAVRTKETAGSPVGRPASPSQARSRAASPLRILQQWSSNIHRNHRHAREEPFRPVDPFKLARRRRFRFSTPPFPPDEESLGSSSGPYECEDVIPVLSIKAFFADVYSFFTDSLARQLYLHFLLRLPAMYFTRVAKIFEDAEVSGPDIQRMIDATCKDPNNGQQADLGAGIPNVQSPPHPSSAPYPPGLTPIHSGDASVVYMPLPFPDDWTPASVSPALVRFKHSWETFIDSLLREWKTLNVVSALLASAILTIFQVQEAAGDPVTRTAAFLSLICALMSLSYGCMYIVRFGTMRSMYRASKWAEEARKTKTLIWWNAWVLLAMPAVWMAWSMLLFLTSILSFVWRTGSEADQSRPPFLSSRAALGPRIAVTAVFALGMVYLMMIIKTLKSYGGGSPGGLTQAVLQAGTDAKANILSRVEEVGFPPHGPNTSQPKVWDDEDPTERRGRGRKRDKIDKSPRPTKTGEPATSEPRRDVMLDGLPMKESPLFGELMALTRINTKTDSLNSDKGVNSRFR